MIDGESFLVLLDRTKDLLACLGRLRSVWFGLFTVSKITLSSRQNDQKFLHVGIEQQ